MNDDYQRAINAFELGELDESKQLVDFLLTKDFNDTEILMLKAKIHYKKQEWGETLNALNNVLAIDEMNSIAINYKQMVMNILSFWNKDSYNP